jgi:hypothetical protein
MQYDTQAKRKAFTLIAAFGSIALGSLSTSLAQETMTPATGDALPAEIAPLAETLSTHSTTGRRVLLYHSDVGALFFEAQLVATGLYDAADIDILEMTNPPPAVETFQAYDCVYVWTNFPPPSPVAQGDRLREYVDLGGGVILATFAYSPTSRPWQMQGGIMDPGYSPLVNSDMALSAFPRSIDFTTALLGHPMLDGVTDFTYGGNSNYTEVSLDPGAELVGSDDFGVPLLALSASGAVAGVNVFPGSIFAKSPGVYRTLANACLAVSVVEASVDIRPQSCPNPLNCKSNGVLPVAIAGTLDFDVATIDPASIRLEGASPLSSNVEDVTAPVEPFTGKQDCDLDCMATEPDGIPDLTLKFNVQDVIENLGVSVEDGACVVAKVTGNLRATEGGRPIVGEDVVRILCKREMK